SARVADNDINVYIDNPGAATIRLCYIHAFGHAGIKWNTPATACLIERNRVGPGGITGVDHCIYAHAQATDGSRIVIRDNDLEGASGFGLHGYDITGKTDAYANVIWGNAKGGAIWSGTGNTFNNNTIVHNGLTDPTPLGGLYIWRTVS